MGQERRRVSHNEMKVCVCSMPLLICRSESGSHILVPSTEMTRTPARRSNSVGGVLYSELRTIWAERWYGMPGRLHLQVVGL